MARKKEVQAQPDAQVSAPSQRWEGREASGWEGDLGRVTILISPKQSGKIRTENCVPLLNRRER